MSSIFGGSKSKSQQTASAEQKSWNEAYPDIKNQFSGLAGMAGQGGNAMSALLGLGGDPAAQEAAFGNFRDSTGYNFKMNEGTRAITSNNSLKGLLHSGSTLRGLTKFGQGLADSSFNDYLSQLLGLTNSGLQAGQLITSAGQKSTGQSQSQGTSSSKSNQGIASTIGAAASLVAASDRRLKKNISEVGKLSNGLTLYEYDYIPITGDITQYMKEGRQLGVMADEVEILLPEALGPIIGGYQTVDYNKIGGF